jgi:hypothetical protein
LVSSDARACPRRVRRNPAQCPDIELQDVAVYRHGVLHTHHELDVQRRIDAAIGCHLRRLEDHRKVEGINLRLDTVDLHLGGKPK